MLHRDHCSDDKEDRWSQDCGVRGHGREKVLCHQLDPIEAEKDHGDVSQALGQRPCTGRSRNDRLGIQMHGPGGFLNDPFMALENKGIKLLEAIMDSIRKPYTSTIGVLGDGKTQNCSN